MGRNLHLLRLVCDPRRFSRMASITASTPVVGGVRALSSSVATIQTSSFMSMQLQKVAPAASWMEFRRCLGVARAKDESSGVVDSAAETVKQGVNKTGEMAKDAAGKVKEEAENVVGAVKSKASDLTGNMGEKIKDTKDETGARVEEGKESVKEAAEKAAEKTVETRDTLNQSAGRATSEAKSGDEVLLPIPKNPS